MTRCAIPLLLLAFLPVRGALDCAPCHRAKVESFALTAHANTSREAGANTIAGPFAPGPNLMRTRSPDVYFRMERRNGRFYQTGVDGKISRTEAFDLVIGSGRRGQSYLYWKDGLLFQLPVSFHAGSNKWINSPGYEDGTVHFGRGIPPQCLDCHATRFRLEPTSAGPRYAKDYLLGLQCAKCHGDAARHEQIIRPSGIELCARCHSGLHDDGHPPEPDVHGNQVGLLKASRCFQQSGTMTCSTCHDVHQVERDPAVLSARCGVCHQPAACPTARADPDARGGCVGCHMPVLPSKLIEVQSYRTHRIAVYRR